MGAESLHSWKTELPRLTEALAGMAAADGPISRQQADALERVLAFLWSDVFRDELAPLFGEAFLDILRRAPVEFAMTTLLAHTSLIIPVAIFLNSLRRGTHRTQLPSAEYLEAAYKELLGDLAPDFASANQSECEFAKIRATSWHEVALQYAVRVIRIVENTVAAGYHGDERSELERSMVRALFRKLHREKTYAVRRLDRVMAGVVLGVAKVADELKDQGLIVDIDAIGALAIRMQQELPRAWAFKYGAGNTQFLKLDDAVYEIVGRCAGLNKRCAPRDAYLLKLSEKGLGPAKIVSHWKALTEAARRQIAPRAYGLISAVAVKKAIQRAKKRRRRGNR